MAEPILTRINESVKARFWAKVDRRGPRECWDWKSRKDRDGYGHFRLSGKRSEYQRVRAHRVALALESGEDHPNLFALHSCDRPQCCNPKHLRWGTQSENMQECLKRGRFYRGKRATKERKVQTVASTPVCSKEKTAELLVGETRFELATTASRTHCP